MIALSKLLVSVINKQQVVQVKPMEIGRLLQNVSDSMFSMGARTYGMCVE